MKHRSLRVGLVRHPRGVVRISRRRSREAHNGQNRCFVVTCGVLATLALLTFARFSADMMKARNSQDHARGEHEEDTRSYVRWPIFRYREPSEKAQLQEEIVKLKAILETKDGPSHRNGSGVKQGSVAGGPNEAPYQLLAKANGEETYEGGSSLRRHPSDGWGKYKPGGGQEGNDEPEHLPVGKFRVYGEPLYGPNPVRQAIESDTALVRDPVPLIVGGTDGSGTRGVVALLQRLNVGMVVEDGGTLDVHASYMTKGGWPQVVKPVLEWARGPNYEARGAPDELRASTIEALGKLKSRMEQSAEGLRRRDMGTTARYVSWGFKAPVSMMLVPFFKDAWGKIKFLHVVRDGRDIAFSGNQTPVAKFYEHTFPAGSRERSIEDPPLKAIRMWNTWNSGLYQWVSQREAGSAAHVDYLLLHAEDLMDPTAKFTAIKDVAEFVGSPLSDKELCCIATEGTRDLGSHTAARADRGKVTSRFGKWKSKVEGNPGLAERLQKEGKEGLMLFGYQPERWTRSSDGYQCRLEREPDCPEPPPAKTHKTVVTAPEAFKHAKKVPDVISDTAQCVGLERDIDFRGNDWKVGISEDHLRCCDECRKAPGCTHFTFDYSSGYCYLKHGKGHRETKGGLEPFFTEAFVDADKGSVRVADDSRSEDKEVTPAG